MVVYKKDDTQNVKKVKSKLSDEGRGVRGHYVLHAFALLHQEEDELSGGRIGKKTRRLKPLRLARDLGAAFPLGAAALVIADGGEEGGIGVEEGGCGESGGPE